MMLLLGVGQLVVYVIGLPLVVLLFLRRNRESLGTHVAQARYGLFYGGYKTDRFFWETVITSRKVSVVMLSVFGPELGKCYLCRCCRCRCCCRCCCRCGCCGCCRCCGGGGGGDCGD